MGRKVNKGIEMAMLTVECVEQNIAALHLVVEGLRRGSYRGPEEAVSSAFTTLHAALYQQLNDAYRQLMLMANLGTEEQRENVRKQAYHQYLRRGISLMGNLELYGLPPRRYYTTDEVAFRKELEEAVGRIPEEDDWQERYGPGRDDRIKEVVRLRKELKLRCGEDSDEQEDTSS